MKSMNELMLQFLQDAYDAEKRGIRGLTKISKTVENPQVKEALVQHRDQSQQQVSRLERVFEMLGKRPRGRHCSALEGLLEEVDETIEDIEKGPVLDAALIANAQAVEHYEIARYGTMVAWARQVGMEEAAELLQETLDEEKESDRLLNEVALQSANREAEREGEEGEEGEGEEGEEDRPRRRAASSRKTQGKSGASSRGSSSSTAKKPASRRGSARK